MFSTYDDWKLATPPEYEEGPEPDEGEEEPPYWDEPSDPLD